MLPLDKLCSDANFALFCPKMAFFKNISFILIEECFFSKLSSIFCLNGFVYRYKHRYYCFDDDFLASDLALGLFSELYVQA